MANTNETYEIKIQTAGDAEVKRLKQNINDLYKQLDVLGKKKTSIIIDSEASETKLAFITTEINNIINKIKTLENQKLKLQIENKEKFTNDLKTASENLKRVNKEIEDLGGKRLKVGGKTDFREVDLIKAKMHELLIKQRELESVANAPMKYKLDGTQLVDAFKKIAALKVERDKLAKDKEIVMKFGNSKQYIDEVNESLKQLNITKRKYQEDKKIAKNAIVSPDTIANVKALNDKLFELHKKLATLTSTKLKLETDPKFVNQLNQNAKAIETVEKKIEATRLAQIEATKATEQAIATNKRLATDVVTQSLAYNNSVKALAEFQVQSYQKVAQAAKIKSTIVNDSLTKELKNFNDLIVVQMKAGKEAERTAQIASNTAKKSSGERMDAARKSEAALKEYLALTKEVYKQQEKLVTKASANSKKASEDQLKNAQKTASAQKKVVELSKKMVEAQKLSYEAAGKAASDGSKKSIQAFEAQKAKVASVSAALKEQINTVNNLSKQDNAYASAAKKAADQKIALEKVIILLKKQEVEQSEKIKKLDTAPNTKQIKEGIRSLRMAADSLMPVGTMLTGIGSALTKVAKSAIQEAVTWEVLRVKLSNFYNTATEATKAFNYLVIKAKTTPFEIKGLVQAAVMLKAFGIEMKHGIEMTGNLAAALGGKITDAAYAMSRAMSGASMGFLMLQRTWGVSRTKLKALGAEFMAGNRLVAGSVKTQEALQKVLEENNGAMERLSKTVQGKMSNLTDAIDTLKESAGQAFLPIISSVVSGITKVVDTIAAIPSEVKTLVIGLTGLAGGLALIAGKAVNAAITMSRLVLAYEQYTLAVEAAKAANIAGSLLSVGTAAASTATAIAASAVALAPIVIIIGALGAAIHAYNESLKNEALVKQTAADIDLLRGSLTDLRNYFPETYSKAAMFNEIITHTSAALLNAADSTYKFKGKLQELFGITEEEFIKQQLLVEQSAKDQVTLAQNMVASYANERAEAERKLYDTMRFGGKLNVSDEYRESIQEATKMMDFWSEAVKRNQKVVDRIHNTYEEGKRILQVYGNTYEELQVRLQELSEKESFEPFNITDQLEKVKELRSMSLKIKEDMRKQVEDSGFKKRFAIDATYNIGEGPRKDTLLKDKKEAYKEALKIAETDYFEKVKIMEEDLSKFQAESANEQIRLRKENDSLWEKIHKLTLDDLVVMEARAMAQIERDRKDKLFPNEKDYEKAKTDAEKGIAKLKELVIDSDATIKEKWKNLVNEQKNLLKAGEIDHKTFISNMVAFQKSNVTRLLTLPDLSRSITAEITTQINNDMKHSWTTYEKNLSNSLDNNEMTYADYVDSIKTYLIEHEDELKNNLDLKLDLESKAAAATKKLEEDTYRDRIKMAKDYVTVIYGTTEGAYINSLNVLNKQRQDYIKAGNDRIEVDEWYYAQKEILDTEYRIKQKQNAIKFAADLAKSQTQYGSLDQQRAEADAHYKEQLFQLEQLAKTYKDDKVSQVEIDKMVAGEKVRIEQERAERVQAIRNEEQARALKFASDLAKSMTEFGSFDEARAEADSYYNNQLAQLAIQAKEYEKQNMSKIKIDQFVSGERIRIETEHANKLQSILLQEEQFYDDMYKKVLDSFVARGELTEANYLRMQKSMLDESIKLHEEAAKIIEKNILAGNSVSKAEAEIYDVYIKQEQTLIDINEQLNTRLDSTGKIYDSNMDILKQDLELKKLRGEISDEKALMIELKYRQDYLQTHKDEMELLRQKSEKGDELTQIEKERLKTYLSESIEQENQLDNYEELTKTAKKVKNEVTGVDEAVKSATKSTDKLSSSMENVADSTAKASNEMVQYGNILAGAADTASGMGNFGTAESMLSNLPGTQGITHENLPYDIVEEMGRSLTDRDMWNEVFDGFYEELGEKTIAANRKDFEEELAEKREFWKRELEDTSLKISGMATDTKTAMDSMSADINAFSQKEVVVNVNAQGGSNSPGEDNPPTQPPGGGGGGSDDGNGSGSEGEGGAGAGGLGSLVVEFLTSAPEGTTFSGGQSHAPTKEREEALKAFGFDNPKNDAVAKSLGAKQSTSIINILQKNTTDILKNYLKGTSEAVKKMYSSTVSNNSSINNNNNITNSKVFKPVYNTNLNGQVLQHTPVPIQRSVKAISDYATRGRYSGGKL